jgi:hypothetical protein
MYAVPDRSKLFFQTFAPRPPLRFHIYGLKLIEALHIFDFSFEAG